jgi:hypothetical protein
MWKLKTERQSENRIVIIRDWEGCKAGCGESEGGGRVVRYGLRRHHVQSIKLNLGLSGGRTSKAKLWKKMEQIVWAASAQKRGFREQED